MLALCKLADKRSITILRVLIGAMRRFGVPRAIRTDNESVFCSAPESDFKTDDSAFGIWRDREDMADVAAYVRKIRQPRYNRDGSRNES